MPEVFQISISLWRCERVHKTNGVLVLGSFCEQYLDIREGDVPCQ